MRAIKKGKYGTVQYVSENYVVRNKDLISKHVFAGNTRLVSNMVMREEKSGKMVSTEQGCYYYHADHLGSSSVVTDKDGKFYEQLEYFPYGETWVHNKAVAEQESTSYKFTGKELDPETGLYYFGARYYDGKLSRWTAVDPPLARGDYLPVPAIVDEAKDHNSKLPGMGGVFNSINIDAYQYAGQNPVKMVDPDGNWTLQIGGGTTGTVGISGTYEEGMAISWGKNGFEMGKYKTYSNLPGGHGDIGISGGLKISLSGNSSIMDLQGDSISGGASVDLGMFSPILVSPGLGYDMSKPLDSELKPTESYSLFASLSVSPLDIHAEPTRTKITKDVGKSNKVNNMINSVRSNYENASNKVNSFSNAIKAKGNEIKDKANSIWNSIRKK